MATDKLNRIILLTGEAEAKALGEILKAINPDLTTVPASDRAALDQACASISSGTRLISFCSPTIVPKTHLEVMDRGCYNFHPGPPNYPGRYPSVFALNDHADRFGVTMHVMAERVDEGPIIAAEWFAISSECDLETLDALAFKELVTLFKRFALSLATDYPPLRTAPIRWSGVKRSKAECETLCRVNASTSPDEVRRLERVCGIHLTREG